MHLESRSNIGFNFSLILLLIFAPVKNLNNDFERSQPEDKWSDLASY